MLQQTQAARVVPRYQVLPRPLPRRRAALAAAPARDVLEEWSGLGYNRRALALQAAARRVAAHGWPATYRAARRRRRNRGRGRLVRVDAQRAAVDVNVRRVIARWDGRAPHAARARRARRGAPPAGRARRRGTRR